MNSFMPGWYLIYTKPRHEKKVYSRLTESNIKSFLPTKKMLRTWHDRKKYIQEPLFPSYVFIYLSNRKDYYDGMDMEGYLYYVKTGKQIARVNDSVVESIQLVTLHAKDLEISGGYFQPGERLVINQGALTGLSCEMIRVDGRQKALVRVDLLQRNLLVTLNPDVLTYA